VSTIENTIMLVFYGGVMPIDPHAVGKRLLKLRELSGKSLSGVAARAGVAKSYLLKLEKGEVPNPGLNTLDAVAKALGVTLGDIVIGGQKATGVSPAKKRLDAHERLTKVLPPGLAEFIKEWEENSKERMPADVVHSLATIQFRGKKPATSRDWRFVYDAVARTIGE
jgi:transcriptional regulator with XRE-family HTH domain